MNFLELLHAEIQGAFASLMPKANIPSLILGVINIQSQNQQTGRNLGYNLGQTPHFSDRGIMILVIIHNQKDWIKVI